MHCNALHARLSNRINVVLQDSWQLTERVLNVIEAELIADLSRNQAPLCHQKRIIIEISDFTHMTNLMISANFI